MPEYLGADRIEGPLVMAEGYGAAAYGELVEVRASAVFGGVDDKTAPPRTTPGVTPPKLIITGFAAFGGIVVKS